MVYTQLVFLHQKKILKFVRKCLAFLKVILGFQKIQREDLVKVEKDYQKKEKLKNLLFL